ncbi:hypothetical protein [Thiorhodovibrio winogradskyi]|uniref:hypothetical protein n=1 Tax=Thiorhodovibrio winogradskyi TaxID=77007 RepID=UPI002E2CE8D8|nr:hypothetical protein [Thiorhodovibrio winogradskyi]
MNQRASAIPASTSIAPLPGLALEDEDRALIPTADAGDAAAQRELGLLFLALRQPERAAHWLHLAAA